MSDSLLVGPVDVQQEWTNWKATHSKTYETPEEEERRFQIFENNVKEVQEHNAKFQAGDESYSKGLNKFSDLTPEEVKSGLNKPKIALFQKR